MSKKWTSPVYAFFKTTPQIEYKDGRRAHVFQCGAGRCRGRNSRYVYRFLDKGDANSTSNLLRHAKICWGADVVESATATRDIGAAREVLIKGNLVNGSILAEFQRIGKGKVAYRHTQHTTTEARYVPLIHIHGSSDLLWLRAEIVRWVSESKRPFQIVKDRAFQSLMKTGRPAYQIPSPETVSRDVKKVFVRVRKRIAKMLQVVSISFILWDTIEKLTWDNSRNTKEPWVLQRMLGRRPITRRMLP